MNQTNARGILYRDELTENPTPRVPVCLCLDVSGSMAGDPIKELNKGVKLFYDSLRRDEIASYSAEICIVTFGLTSAKCVADFTSLEYQADPPQLAARGLTPMGEAVNIALDKLEARKASYQEKGIDYFQPWLVLMTDGSPNGEVSELMRAQSRTRELVESRKLSFYPIGIGSEANAECLRKFSPSTAPLKLKGLEFSKFFQWLSQSIEEVSQSVPGDTVEPDKSSFKEIFESNAEGWDDLEY